jgi:hypothetical protein
MRYLGSYGWLVKTASARINTIPVRATGGPVSARSAGIGPSSIGCRREGRCHAGAVIRGGDSAPKSVSSRLITRGANGPTARMFGRGGDPHPATVRNLLSWCNRDGAEDPAHSEPSPRGPLPWGGCDLNVGNHELRSAIERFLAAKRALRHAYRRSVASHQPAEFGPRFEGRASEPTRKDLALTEELDGLKEENGRLRKSLALLHAYSLKLQDQLDSLLLHGTEAAGACEAVAPGTRENSRAEPYPVSAADQLDGHIYEYIIDIYIYI